MLFEAERREVDTRPEDLGLGQDADTTHSVDIHLHVGITVGIAQIRKMRSPSGIFGITLHYDGILVERVCQCKGSFGFLPRIQVVRLLSTKPIRKWPPNI